MDGASAVLQQVFYCSLEVLVKAASFGIKHQVLTVDAHEPFVIGFLARGLRILFPPGALRTAQVFQLFKFDSALR